MYPECPGCGERMTAVRPGGWWMCQNDPDCAAYGKELPEDDLQDNMVDAPDGQLPPY